MEPTEYSIDLAQVYDRYRPALPYALGGLGLAFYVLSALFGG